MSDKLYYYFIILLYCYYQPVYGGSRMLVTGSWLLVTHHHHHHHQSSSRHRTHKAFTVSLQCERSCATFRISLQVKCMVLSSFSVDPLQVVLGLPRCLFPSGVQSRPSLAMWLGSFLSTCPIWVHFLRVKLTMMSPWLQILRTSKFVTFCGHLMPSIMRRHLWVETLSF